MALPLSPEKSMETSGAWFTFSTFGKPFAAAASIGASNKEAIDEISVALKSYTEDLLKELRIAEDDKLARAEQYFNLAVEIAALVFNSEEAEFLRRRGRAAMPAAA